MDNTRLIDLAMKAFALGLCEGHELADQQLGVRVRTGRSLMQKLLPTTSNTLPRDIECNSGSSTGQAFISDNGGNLTA